MDDTGRRRSLGERVAGCAGRARLLGARLAQGVWLASGATAWQRRGNNFGGVPPTNALLGSAEAIHAYPARGRLRHLGRDRRWRRDN